MVDLVVSELRPLGDLGLEGHCHELLRPLAGDDQLPALVRGDVAVPPPERIPRVGDVKRLPAAAAKDRAQPLHLGAVELERVGAQRLGIFLVVLAALGHDGPILAEMAPMTRKTSARDHLVARRAAFQGALLAWYRARRRPLPWREAPSPYRTVVSEFMLQQTQVATVLPYFGRWMEALPDFGALAAAPEAGVLKLWEGLGYYSRARNLHRLARSVARAGRLPRTAAGWEELPGVGPYTAAAVASIAFGEPVACVDGNVVRILARICRDGTRFRDSASASRALAPLAQELVNPADPGDHNQAMMELGATVCLKRRPSCPVCPARGFCACA